VSLVAPSVKDTFMQTQLPATLARLKALTLQIDQHYHQCMAEKAVEHVAANPPPSGKTSRDGSTSSPAGGGGKSKGKGKGPGSVKSFGQT
jgi:hypothetical protein